jgi:phosphate starvation-inducible PhoH-like protein
MAKNNKFHIDFKTTQQKMAWAAYQQHDALFLTGPAGTGKTFLAVAFAIHDVLQKEKSKIILTRPIVEAGEKLGFLPGQLEEKVNPYMIPLFDSIDKLIPSGSPQKEQIKNSCEIAPIAYLRGRSQPLSSKILTPDGFKLMKDIKVGDKVIGSDGKPIDVLRIYPQGKLPVYKITFSDHTVVRCSEDHLWNTMTLSEKRHKKGFTTKSLKEIKKCVINKFGKKNHKMPLLKDCVEFNSKKIEIDPYLLGLLIGDGHIRTGKVKLTNKDLEIIEEVKIRLPEGVNLKKMNEIDYDLTSKGKNKLLSELKQLGLVGSLSFEKFIPEDYKINSFEVRKELMRGLMDSDGSISITKNGKERMQFYTTSLQLAKDMMFLTRSLGGNAYMRKRELDEDDCHMLDEHLIRHVRPCYIVDIATPFNPFKTSRKADKFIGNRVCVKLIKKVELEGEEECQCIKVDSEDSLYVTDDFVLTHNTFDNSVCIFDEAQNATLSQLRLFMSRLGENSKMIITGDPSQSDLEDEGGLMEVMHRLETVSGVSIIKFKEDAIVRHPLVAAILKKLED